MKKLLLVLTAAFFYFGNNAQAQTGQTSAGVTVDFGDGVTAVGPAVRHYFTGNAVGQAEVLFGSGSTFLAAYYQYTDKVKGAAGLNWYVGIGPQIGFGNGNTAFYIKPMVGLDYKLEGTPIDLAFDWRPTFYTGSGSSFTGGRFGLGVRFAF